MTTPKKPEDHKPKKSDQLAAEAAAPPAGAALLKPSYDLPSWDRLEVMATLTETFESLGFDLDNAGEEFELHTDAKTLRAIAKMQRELAQFAVDNDEYEAFAKRPDAVSEITNLAMWYLGALGESEDSAT